MDSKNTYTSLPKVHVDDENHVSREQSSDEDLDNRADPHQLFAVPLQITDFQFTLEIVQDMQRLRDIALDHQNHEDLSSLEYPDMNGDLRTCWMPSEHPELDNVAIYPLCLSEMTEAFHRDMPHKKVSGYKALALPYSRGDKVELLHEYNASRDPAKPKDEWIPLPFIIDNVPFPYCKTHEKPMLMERWYTLLNRTTHLWKRSKAKNHVVNTIQEASKWSVPIKKIVGIGLGSFDARPAWYSGVLQHLFMITVAFTLNQINQATDPACPPVQCLLQDPMYAKKDKMLLEHLCPGYPIQIVNDPDALLATDEHTLVIAPFLNNSYPLMQIYAGMFKDKAGPAGFLCDEIKGDPERKEWRCTDRDSPEVWRMLGKYQKCTEEMRHDLDEELLKQVNGFYWMEKMDLHLREKKP